MEKSKWVWMPHAGHYVCGSRCEFKLNTYVGGYIVSTVGEMRELGSGEFGEFIEIGPGRKYETMVFIAEKHEDVCCPYRPATSGIERDFKGYNDSESAAIGHMKMCKKWAKKNEKEKGR
jgi:hypothetical protein